MERRLEGEKAILFNLHLNNTHIAMKTAEKLKLSETQFWNVDMPFIGLLKNQI